MAVLAALAGPGFSRMLSNYRVRSGAESVVNGLNYARAEAVKRNRAVRFALSGTASGWTIEQVSPGVTIQSRAAGDSPGITASSSNTGASITFLPTGLVDASGTWLTKITVASSDGGADSRQIDILGGGLIRMCDPAVTTANDPRRC